MEHENVFVADINDGSRKRKKRGRTKQNNKHLKYSDKDPLALNFQSTCDHNTTTFKCSTLTVNEIIYNRQLLYKNIGKIAQDTYLSRLVAPYPVKRNRPRPSTTKVRGNKFSVTYYLLRDSKHMVLVCKKFFLSALELGKHRVVKLAKTLFEGNIPYDKRGGDRVSSKSVLKKESVRKFISALPAKESHYNRRKSKRIYLSYELNITTLWKYYNVSVSDNLKVTETMFRRVFESDFNIGFSSPASDVCSTCVLYKNRLKIEKDPDQIATTKAEFTFHKLRAKAFTVHSKQRAENSLSLCFDLQQVQPLPKTPIQESFYRRQIGLYSLCITDMDTKTPYFFLWTENQANKGSVEIASALLSYLSSVDLSNVEVLRLFADGCGGQNKNSHVIHMLIFWLKNTAPSNLKKVILFFPVRGHSYLPADRVFGRVEKDLRKKPFILTPKEYYEIYAKHGIINILGEDWNLFDIKGLQNCYNKLEYIREAKRIIIEKSVTNNIILEGCGQHRGQKRGRSRGRGGRGGRERGRGSGRLCTPMPLMSHLICGIKSFSNYNSDENTVNYTCLLKEGKNHTSLIRRFPIGNQVKPVKKKDVQEILIKQYGSNWIENPELQWYKDILTGTSTAAIIESTAVQHDDDCADECDCLEEEVTELTL